MKNVMSRGTSGATMPSIDRRPPGRAARLAVLALMAGVLLLPAAATPAPATEPAAVPAAAASPQAAPAGEGVAADPAAPKAEAASPAGSPPAPQAIENPYGLSALWAQGDLVARATLAILAIMSMGTWYIMITKLIEQTRMLAHARAVDRHFWSAGTVQESVARLKRGSAFRYVAETGLSAAEHHEGTLVQNIDLHTWVTMSIQRAGETVNARLQRGLAFLATVGSTAPFVGLFGTVWGIYHALIAIGVAGQASIDKVAGPVGEALIMTAIGLAVAVPAVLGYNWLVRRNKLVNDRVRTFSADLHALLLSGTAVAARPGRAPASDRAA